MVSEFHKMTKENASLGMQNKCQKATRTIETETAKWRKRKWIYINGWFWCDCKLYCEWHVRVRSGGCMLFTANISLIRLFRVTIYVMFLVCFLNVVCVFFFASFRFVFLWLMFLFIIQSHSIINDRCLVIAKRWAENNDFLSVAVAVVVVAGIVVVVGVVFVIIIVRGGVAFRPNDTYSSNESKSHQSVARIKGIELVTPIQRNTEGKSRQREEYLNEIHFWHETIIISKMINDCSLWVWVCGGGYVCVSERTAVSLTILRQK